MLAYIVFTFTVIQLIVALVNLLFETTLPKARIADGDLVSVLIPARNEENNIKYLLEDLSRLDYRNIEIIVFNDQSDDLTAEIVEEYSQTDKRVKILHSQGLPEGWLGKNHACHTLAGNAKGKYFLFLDADVRISGKIMQRAVSFSEKHDLAMISIFPKQIILSHGERMTVPNMNYILVSLLPLTLVRRSAFPSISAANGQFMFFRADEYRSFNPHELLKDNKVEDIAIARLFKKNSLKVACLLGDEEMTCRMYSGFGEAVKGFSKNVTAFFGNSFIIALLFWIITSLGFLAVYSALSLKIFIIFISAYILTRIVVSSASRQNLFYNILYIIPLQLSLLLFIYNAFINKYFKKFEWKGRNID